MTPHRSRPSIVSFFVSLCVTWFNSFGIFQFSFNFLSFHPQKTQVKLERVLGLTVTSNAALACDPNTGTIAYPAGYVATVHPRHSIIISFFIFFVIFFLVKNVAKSDDDPSFPLHADRFVVLIVFAAPF